MYVLLFINNFENIQYFRKKKKINNSNNINKNIYMFYIKI